MTPEKAELMPIKAAQEMPWECERARVITHNIMLEAHISNGDRVYRMVLGAMREALSRALSLAAQAAKAEDVERVAAALYCEDGTVPRAWEDARNPEHWRNMARTALAALAQASTPPGYVCVPR